MSASMISILKTKEKQLFLEGRTELYCKAGDLLFSQGQSANHMYRIEKGKVSLFRLMPNGDEKLFKVFMAGDIFAEVALFLSPRKYPMSARIEQDSILSSFSYDHVFSTLHQCPELSLRILGFMGNRIGELMNTIDILTQVNANQRLVMKLAEIYKKQYVKENRIALPCSKKLLASQLGMTPETLSRTMKKLKTEGLIEEVGSNLLLPDIPSLCRSVNLTQEMFSAA
ncbi:Crp/Fnr family transcriptional regulator [Agarivorans sp. OAG1]|uniref:Crp/Fnr family transcriptional regulator n=1 Tax=unclassified Agarivorans TaxID=2636026 RepID=UPI002B2EFA41|nr:Crp/Fnr family transcriptional regulator [Agarivorans sp. OAG1]